MFAKPTYISFLLCVACVVSSCSTENQEDIPGGAGGSEVSFSVAASSRASVTTSFGEFAVYGDMKSQAAGNADPIVTFNKVKVENNNGVWSYEGIQYWFPNHEHSFVAVYPPTVLEAANAPQYDSSKLTFTYSLPVSNDNLVIDSEVADIVAATHRRLYSENDANNVTTLHFAHLLSQINFSFELTAPSMKSEDCFKIHKLEMSGFGTSATINIKPAPILTGSQTDDSEIDIVTANGSGSLEISFDEPIEVISGAAAVKMFDSNNAIIMLPQALEGNDKVQISLTYTANDEAEETQVSANLSNFKWERGRSYNYKIKLELEQKDVNIAISEATILPWNLVEGSDIVDVR